jgi:hypothetical protein
MNHVLPFTGPCWAAVLVVVIGVSAYGCKDSVSVSDEAQVPLASLTITPPDTLQPSFSSNTTSYTAEVPKAVTSVDVTASPKDSTTTMTINGVVTAAGQARSVPLGQPGSTTTIPIVLSSQTGTESTYTVTVARLLSSDNTLSALSVAPGSLAPRFAVEALTYTVDVATKVTSVTISATKSDPDAVMLIGSVTVPAGTISGQAPIQLGEPGTATPVSIDVTAPNGSKKAYTITVTRLLSNDNNLSALTVSVGTSDQTLSPKFAAGTRNYTVDVATDVIEVTVTATKSDPNAVISGDVSNEGQATIPLDGPGTSKTISIIVTAPNGNAKTYTITVNKAASSDNRLSDLTVTPGPLRPAFAARTTTYTVDVAADVTSVDVSAIKSDADAVISGSLPNQGQATIPLDGPGTSKDILISVTAPNGNTKTYRITVNRLSNNNNLSALTVDAGAFALNPAFTADTLSYMVDVPIITESVTLSATKSDPNAVMALGSVSVAAGTATGQTPITLNGIGAPTSASITVTAPSGDVKTYTVTINRVLI